MDVAILVFPMRITFYLFFNQLHTHLSEKMNLGVIPGSRHRAISSSTFCHAQGWRFGSATGPSRLWYTGRRGLSWLAPAIQRPWAFLEQNREKFSCFSRNNLFCNGQQGHFRGETPILHFLGHPAHPLEVLAEGTDILPGAGRFCLSWLILWCSWSVQVWLPTACPSCYLQWWISCHQT